MKTNLILMVLLTLASSGRASAQMTEVTCRSSSFPNEKGSELVLKFEETNPKEAYLYLGEKGPFQSLGWYGTRTALNENGTPVIYLNWQAGSGKEPTPNTMVIYAFDANYEHGKSLFLGVIEWVNGDKIEKHHSLKCD